MSDSSQRDDETFEEQRPRRHRPEHARDEPPPLPDDYDERRRRSRRHRREVDHEEDDALSTIIPYHNGRALAAYYCGVFSFLCFIGIPVGILSIVLGILGLNYAKKYPRAKGTGHAIAGIVLGTISLALHLVVIVAMPLMGWGLGARF